MKQCVLYVAIATKKRCRDHDIPGQTEVCFFSDHTSEMQIKQQAVTWLCEAMSRKSILFVPDSFNLHVFTCEHFVESHVNTR